MTKDVHACFQTEGYHLAQGLIPIEPCENLVGFFNKEVKRFEGELLRVSTSEKEKHYFSDKGLMVNPIMDIQDFEPALFPKFYEAALEVLANKNLQSIAGMFVQDKPVLVQSGYFESSLGSVPHIDSYFFDSEEQSLIACWIALEDIKADAGRFSLYPKSHKLGVEGEFPDEIHNQFHEYQSMAKDIIECSQIKKNAPSLAQIRDCRTLLQNILSSSGLVQFKPGLKAGDVVFFSSKTIHGSDMPVASSSTLTRNSLIGHFTPLSQKLIRYGKLEEHLDPYTFGDLLIQPRSIR